MVGLQTMQTLDLGSLRSNILKIGNFKQGDCSVADIFAPSTLAIAQGYSVDYSLSQCFREGELQSAGLSYPSHQLNGTNGALKA